MNARRLFVASCIALITSAFSFQVRQNIADPLAADFSLTKQEIGEVMGAAFIGMAIAMLAVAPLCDLLGMGTVLFMAWMCHLTGILGTIFAPEVRQYLFPEAGSNASYWLLWAATFLVGCGNGLVEIAINPLAATLFPREKTHYLNVLHAWWPGGLIMSGLLILWVVNPLIEPRLQEAWPQIHGLGWKLKMAMLLIPLATYGLMSVGQRFPVTERVQANVSTGEMFLQVLRPMFLLWAFCMLLTASTELGPNQWQESVLTRTAHVSGTLIFVYTSGLMFVMRFFAGPLAHRLSPVGMLTVSAMLSAAGLYWLSYVDNGPMAFAAATIFGVGIAYFWPTMLGVTAERFPKGGALLLGLMGCFGNLAISQVLPQMGAIYDSYTVANIPSNIQKETLKTDDGKEVPVIIEGQPSWLPLAVTERIFPAGMQKLNPDAEKLLRGENRAKIEQAEVVGARYAFRWVAVLPCVLVVIFGLIALSDRLRGGYRAVHINDGRREDAAPP
jgi:MFS family permease